MIEDAAAAAASAKSKDKPSTEAVTNHSILRQQTVGSNQCSERPVSVDPTVLRMPPVSMGFQQSTL